VSEIVWSKQMPDEQKAEEFSEKLKAVKEKLEKMGNWVAVMASSIAIAIGITMATGLFFVKTKTLNN